MSKNCEPEMSSHPGPPSSPEKRLSILRRVPPNTILTNDQVLQGLKNGKYCLIPKRNHRACFGRGYIGRNVKTGETVPCTCLRLYEICIPELEELEKLRKQQENEEHIRLSKSDIDSPSAVMVNDHPHASLALDISNEK